jgi:class 3 adenylate cyclase
MKNKFTYSIPFFILINLFLLVFSDSSLHSQENPELDSVKKSIAIPQAEKGILDLREWDFEKDGRVELNGEWEFYWMEFLDDFGNGKNKFGDKLPSENSEKQQSQKYYLVPSAWNGMELDIGQTIDQDGYATFRLKLLLPEIDSDRKIGFHIYDGQGSAYEMYFGDVLVAQNGRVGTKLEEEKPIYLPQYGELYLPDNREVVITVFISNFTHKNGGFQTPIKLGLYSSILRQKEILRSIEIFLSGVLLIIALYHFSLFFYRKKDKTALWFGVLCLAMLLRLIITGERLLVETFPEIPFSILLRMEYIGFYGLVPPFGLFLFNLFPEEFRKSILKLIVVYPLLNIAIVLLFPIKYFTITLPFFHIATILVMIYITYILIIAVRRKKEGAKLFLFGFSAYFLAAINDLVFYNLQGNTLYVLPLGLFVFIFAQAGALAHRIGEAFNSSEELSVKLEERVEERTQELDHALLEMEKAMYLTEVEKKKSELQKRAIQELNRLIKSLNEERNIETIMDKVHSYLNSNYNLQYYGLYGIDKDKKKLVSLATKIPEFVPENLQNKLRDTKIPIDQSKGAHKLAIKRKNPFYVEDSMNERWISKLTEEEIFIIHTNQARNMLMVPLLVNNEPVGFLNLTNSKSELKLSKYDIDQISILGENLAGIVLNSKLFSEVEEEKVKADKLLLNILPATIATELKETNQVKPQHILSASVLFTDFVGFTQISEKLSPEDLIQELDGCFSQFDEICKHNNLEKLKTIGDAYMCAGGLPLSNTTHPIDICLAALEFRSFMKQMGEIKRALNLTFWELRIGIHTGSVTAGVIGTNKFTYDIWGDSVNTASRMESSGEAGKINISGSTYELVKNLFLCEYRGKVQAKGKGEVDMYFLERILPEFSADEDGLVPKKDFFLSLQKPPVQGVV